MGVNYFNRNERDTKFVLFEHLKMGELLKYDRYKDFSQDDFEMIIQEGLKVAKEVLGPTMQDGDREGCGYDEGKVTVPESFHHCWKVMAENGWISMSGNPERRGTGTPGFPERPGRRVFCRGQHGLHDLPRTDHVQCRRDRTLRDRSGPGDVRGKAQHRGLGRDHVPDRTGRRIGRGLSCGPRPYPIPRPAIPRIYKIEGNKRFITCGDHNLTENIIHLVLARIEGGPPGTKGISLFIVPKVWVNPDGIAGRTQRCLLHRHRAQDGDPRFHHRLAQFRRKRKVPRDSAGRTPQRHGQDVPDDERGPHGLRGPVPGPGGRRL